jgi:predicted O-methyltransferase YrrM
MTREERIREIIVGSDKGWGAYYNMMPELIRERGYKQGIEIGVFAGGHAESILNNSNLDLLVGIDPYKILKTQNLLHTQEDYDYLYISVLNRLNSNRYTHLRMTSDEAYLKLILNKRLFDFVFIDGMHIYSQIKRDLNNYETLIRRGGVIACHDYHHPNYPRLTEAIDEFAKQHNTKIVIGPYYAMYMEKTWE